MRYLFILVFVCIEIFHAKAQNNFSYVSDRKFADPEELLGYNFKPFRLEIRDEHEENLEVGAYSFGITQNNLYISGKDIEGVYSINNINTTPFGFQLSLMNARNPALQGHLKIILNKNKQVEALIFKRSEKEKEIIFHIAKLKEDQRNKEEAYFTDRNEMEIPDPDSLYGKTIFPMTVIYTGSGIQDKFAYTDSVYVKFEKKTTITEKIIKEKKKKPKKVKKEKKSKKKEKDADKNKPEDEIDEDASEDVNTEKTAPIDKEESKIEEESDSSEVSDKPTEENVDVVANEEENPEEPKKEVTITTDYFATINYMDKMSDGTSEKRNTVLKVKKLVQKEDKESELDKERFQIEVIPTSGSSFYIYLNADRTVNSVELQDKKMFVRGN